MQKLKNIEFLRVFLIITIVLFHMRVSLKKLGGDFYINMYDCLNGGSNGVEAFFIIAGFFLILTFKNFPVWEFIKKKYFRLMPTAMFSIIILAVARIFNLTSFKVIPNIVMGLLFSHFGIYWCKGDNIALWFVSALFFGLIVFYLIIKFAKEKYHIPIFLTLGIGSYVLLSLLGNGLYKGHSTMYFGFIPACTLRAFGGIGLGCVIAIFYQKYKDSVLKYVPSKAEKFAITILEFITFGFIVWWSYFKTTKSDGYLYVLFFSVLFICFLCKKGYLSNLTDKNIWAFIAKYSYSLFCIHIPVMRILFKGIIFKNDIFIQINPLITITCILIIVFVCTLFTYYIIERPCHKFLSKRFLQSKNT